MLKVKVFNNLTKKLPNGIEKLQNKVLLKPNAFLERDMPKGKAFHNLMKKLSNDILKDEMFRNLMKKL
uniref:Uncharacterized protein n=1 Tax=Plectus sambesii TaxID=2011161 RepID=A0A914X2X0_9BILA